MARTVDTIHIEQIFRAALSGVDPARLLGQHPFDGMVDRPLSDFSAIRILGAGKAGIPMARAAEDQLGDLVSEGLVVVPHGYPEKLPPGVILPERIAVHTASHPVPDSAGEEAARAFLQIAGGCGPDDLLIVLLSGGGSALLSLFADAITTEDAQTTFKLLLNSGAGIHEVNAVRKHVSRITGGRLARAAYPASVCTLIISDVVGDDPSVIASGPTTPDPTSVVDAIRILQRYDILCDLPESVRHYLRGCIGSAEMETPKPGDPIFEKVTNKVIGSNRHALESAKKKAIAIGFDARIMDDRVSGEARAVAEQQVASLERVDGSEACLLWGGETTVTVTGSGKGGRNQELALAVAIRLEGSDGSVEFMSAGTDGIDGPTDSAGALVSSATASEARRKGLIPEEFLQNNDAYSFFERTGGHLKTGPTHTNVMDLQIALVHRTL